MPRASAKSPLVFAPQFRVWTTRVNAGRCHGGPIAASGRAERSPPRTLLVAPFVPARQCAPDVRVPATFPAPFPLFVAMEPLVHQRSKQVFPGLIPATYRTMTNPSTQTAQCLVCRPQTERRTKVLPWAVVGIPVPVQTAIAIKPGRFRARFGSWSSFLCARHA